MKEETAYGIKDSKKLLQTYRYIEKCIGWDEENKIKKPKFSKKEDIKNQETQIKVLKLLGRLGIQVRFGTFLWMIRGGYYRVNLENSSKNGKSLQERCPSLARIIYLAYHSPKELFKRLAGKNKEDIENWEIHHICKNKQCINPNHLMTIRHKNHHSIERLTEYYLGIRQMKPEETSEIIAKIGDKNQELIKKIKNL